MIKPMIIYAVANHKGGVGKTTTSINVAAGLVERNKRVLLIDLDPQANLSMSLGVFYKPENPDWRDIYNAFKDRSNLPIVNIKKNLDLVPSSNNLLKIEAETNAELAKERILLDLLAGVSGYDYCIMDCPPSLGMVTINALVACNEVLIPMEAEYLAYKGINSLTMILEQVKKYFNPSVGIKGVFFTKYNANKVLTKEIEKKVFGVFGERLLKTSIRTNVALSEAQSNGVDIFEYDPKSNGALDYKNLVSELLKN